jgi:hypothetical protein
MVRTLVFFVLSLGVLLHGVYLLCLYQQNQAEEFEMFGLELPSTSV